MEHCCSTECLEMTHLPLEEQVKLRRGKQVGNKIFRKGKSENLKFKHSGELSAISLAKATDEKPKTLRQKLKIKKTLVGKAEHFFVKASVAQFEVTNGEIQLGDTLLISGPSTGNQEVIISKMRVNGVDKDHASVHDKITFEVPFRVRLSDKLFKIIA
jgi:UPF0176 protein